MQNKMNQGKVWLVGAGPSEEGLFTIKGKIVLQQAEVVFYDSLVGLGILAMIPKEAEKINVGKRAGNHTMPQEEINQLLLQKAMEGKRVVRLKGGDPFVFGRGGEELELLVEHGIPYEIVPGVTSAVAVAAYNGIPVTHRDLTSSFHIITGHKKQGEQYDIDFQALVQTRGTLVFLMGVKAAGDICQGLLKAGMEPEMPAAILSRGTTAEQSRLIATVGTLEKEMNIHPVMTPAVIVVGKVCGLSEKFSWYEKLPLSGRRILVTRPKNRSSKLTEPLRAFGAEVLELPAITLKPLLTTTEFQEAYDNWKDAKILVFTSPSGVDIFFDTMRNAKMDLRCLAGKKLAAIGSATERAIQQRGLFVDYVPDTYEAGALGRTIAENLKGGEKILIPRAEQGNPELVQELEKKTRNILELPMYRTEHAMEDTVLDVTALVEEGSITYVTFTSASTVRGFVSQNPKLDYSKVSGICIGEKTQKEAQNYGMQTITAKEATMDSMVECILMASAKA